MKNKLLSVITVIFLLVVALCNATFAAEPADGVQILKYDREANLNNLPDNFRTAQSIFKDIQDGKTITRDGLDNLRMSGSSSFAKKEFKEMIRYLPKSNLVILDLRNESHGYIGDSAVSWYSKYKTFNKNKDAKEIDKREHILLNSALKSGTVEIARLAKDKSIKYLVSENVNSVMTEQEFVESQGVKYYRIPIMDYSAPTDKNIDDFIKFYKSLPQNTWIHAHCEAGVGRTTICLSMIDMINNADKLSYDEIMTRQVMLGGEDVRQSAAKATDPYKMENYPKRATFTKHFYDYVKAHPQLDITWSDWAKQQNY